MMREVQFKFDVDERVFDTRNNKLGSVESCSVDLKGNSYFVVFDMVPERWIREEYLATLAPDRAQPARP